MVAVDSSPDMLARVQRATTLTSRIQDLHLPDRFDAVLLASHLINTPDLGDRHEPLAAIARHLRPGGSALVEWHPPAWFDALDPARTSTGAIGEVSSTFRTHSLDGGLLTATVTYQAQTGPDRSSRSRWTHRFTARRLDLAQLRHEAARAGLALVCALPDADQWLLATTTAEGPGRT